jgi:ABC-2 type transport system permease protein
VFFTIMLGGALFSTLSLIVASIVKKRERFMGIGQVITMPLFFASNALYPIDIMPKAIRYFSLVNPLTYMVDALRTLMIANQTSVFGLGTDYLVLVLVFALLVAIGTRLYPKILY